MGLRDASVSKNTAKITTREQRNSYRLLSRWTLKKSAEETGATKIQKRKRKTAMSVSASGLRNLTWQGAAFCYSCNISFWSVLNWNTNRDIPGPSVGWLGGHFFYYFLGRCSHLGLCGSQSDAIDTTSLGLSEWKTFHKELLSELTFDYRHIRGNTWKYVELHENI